MVSSPVMSQTQSSQAKEEFYSHVYAANTDGDEDDELTSEDEGDVSTDEESGPLKRRLIPKLQKRLSYNSRSSHCSQPESAGEAQPPRQPHTEPEAASSRGKHSSPWPPSSQSVTRNVSGVQLIEQYSAVKQSTKPSLKRPRKPLPVQASTEAEPPEVASLRSLQQDDENAPQQILELDRGFTTSVSQPKSQHRPNDDLFKGFVFFYYPDHKDKKPHVQKAIARGAEWENSFNNKDRITHIIFKLGVEFRDLLNDFDILPILNQVTVVNEGYTFDCMRARRILDPSDEEYLVPGYQKALSNSQTLPNPASRSSGSESETLKSQRQRASETDLTENATEGIEKPEAKAGQDPGFQLVRKWKPKHIFEREAARGRGANALEETIEEVKKTRDLPLDDSAAEEADESSEDNESEDDRIAKRARLARNRGVAKAGQGNWACMQKSDGLQSGSNPNARIMEVLQKMADYYERTHDQWRAIGYRKAITTLKNQTRKILFKDEARALPFIGERLAAKIEEIVRTNRLWRLESTTLEPTDRALQTFLQIYGVGFKQAHVWIGQGLRTLDDVRAKATLTPNQRIGLEHCDDFQQRIPRAEVAAHVAFVEAVLAEVSPTLRTVVGGSYRRGAPDCGDVDFIVTASQASLPVLRNLVLKDVIPRLFAAGYLRAGLALGKDNAGSKWHGAACLPNIEPAVWRRVDFLLVPEREWGAALLYFTGNDIFNRSIRLLASRKSWRLNQHGLWKDVVRGPQRQRITQGTLLEARSEERILELLGVPWRPPEHRIC